MRMNAQVPADQLSTTTVCAGDGVIHQRGRLLCNFGSFPRYESSGVRHSSHETRADAAALLPKFQHQISCLCSCSRYCLHLSANLDFFTLQSLCCQPLSARATRLCLHALSIQTCSNHRHQRTINDACGGHVQGEEATSLTQPSCTPRQSGHRMLGALRRSSAAG